MKTKMKRLSGDAVTIGHRGMQCGTIILAIALSGGTAPVLALDFTVDSTADEADTAAGDLVCASASGHCTLRAALDESNAVLGSDRIELPPGTYTLSLGQLEILDDLTLHGQNARTTIIDGAQKSRVFAIYPDGWVIADNHDHSVSLFSRVGVFKQTIVPASSGTSDLVNAIHVESGAVHILSLSSLRTYDVPGAAQRSKLDVSAAQWPSDVIYGPWPQSSYAYVLDYVGNKIVRYDANSGALSPFSSDPALAAPNSVIYAPGFKQFLVSNSSGNNVLRFDGTTGQLVGTLGATSGLQTPRGLAIGRDGNLYVASQGTHSVLRYDGQNGNFIGTFATIANNGNNEPGQLVFGPEGDLYVNVRTSASTWSILRYDGNSGAYRGVLVAGYPGAFDYVGYMGAGSTVNLQGLTLTNGAEDSFGEAGGGVVSRYPETKLTLEDCVVRQNHAAVQGGGIYNQGSLQLMRTQITDNHVQLDTGGGVQYSGGGLFNQLGVVSILDSVIDHNQATRGGGIANYAGEIWMVNSTVSGNSANTRGGGILNIFKSQATGTGARLSVSFSTITDNSANLATVVDEPSLGGGIYNTEIVTLSNTILAGNHDRRDPRDTSFAPDCYNGLLPGDNESRFQLASTGGTILGVSNAKCMLAANASDRVGTSSAPVDPGLLALGGSGGNDLPVHALSSGSPAIDAAQDYPTGTIFLTCPDHDERGASRPADGDGDGTPHCDIGAFELTATKPPAPRPALLIVGDPSLSASDSALAARLVAANFIVTVRDDSANFDDAAVSFKLVLISETVDSSVLPRSLAQAAVPILCLEPAYLDELEMTGTNWDVDQGAATGERSLALTLGPLSSGFGGEVEVTTSPAKLSWGVPATPGALLVGQLVSAPGHWAIFGYDNGAMLGHGTRAPAARLAWFAADTTPELLSDAAWQMFDSALDWLVPH